MRAAARFAASAAFFCLACALSAQEMPASQPSVWSSRPDAAGFEKLENERLRAAEQSVADMAAVRGPRTVENTLAPYDNAVRQLNTANYLSTLMQQVHPDASFRDRATAMTTKISAAISGLSLNRAVYDALAAIDVSHADPATRYYVQRQLLEFRPAWTKTKPHARASRS